MQRRYFLGALTAAGLAGTAYVYTLRAPDVMYVSTEMSVVERMLKLAEVSGKDIVYDLGCGDGRFVVTAARQFGARGVGIDIDPVRVKEARELAQRTNTADRARFLEADIFKTDLSEATVVTLFLAPLINLKLRSKLLAELKPGTRVASHMFDMGDWKPEKIERVGASTIYLWRISPRA